MHRIFLSTLSLAAAVAAQESYEELLEEARRLEHEIRPGDATDAPLERAYRKLGEAALLVPDRWEAYAMRGANRCTTAVVCRARLRKLLSEARATGDAPEVVENKERAGVYYIEALIKSGRHDFQVMRRAMRARGYEDPDRLKFAVAALQYARAEYLTAEGGAAGAIDEFKALVERGFNVEHCSEFIARCYLELGVAAADEDDYVRAQAYWDTALEWSRTKGTKRVILSNKAAGFDLDHEYGRAEKIVKQQIEMEPGQPGHWKNLGLMLGHQNRLRAALRAYERCRELCRRIESPVSLGYFHGNAWLKAAMIHGKLLEQDGDVLLAWRLFLEYRAMFGDDYNFCLNFGDFAFQMRQYELAWQFLERARDLQPICMLPHQLLLMTAQRMRGPSEEVRERIKRTRAEHRKAANRFRPQDEPAALGRLCGGLRDRRAGEGVSGPVVFLGPDPLAAYGPDQPPTWLAQVAAARSPFQESDPDPVEEGGEDVPEPTPEAKAPRRSRGLLWIVSAVLVLLAGLGLWRGRRRP